MKKTVTGYMDSDMFNAKVGKKCIVLRTFWYNRESWYLLRDIETKEKFESPCVFWI